MRLSDLPFRSQDYLKAIFDVQEWSGAGVGLTQLAAKVGQQNSTASEAVKRLAAQGLVNHRPYAPISLTDLGHELAIQMVRRHRLIETYLCHELGYSLDEVHDEAEELEHAVSEKFLARIDELMGYPDRDPHGDPIPNAAGQLPETESFPLTEAAVGDVLCVERVSDSDPDLLRHLEGSGVTPGVHIRVDPRPFEALAEFSIVSGTRSGSVVSLPAAQLSAVRCIRPA